FDIGSANSFLGGRFTGVALAKRFDSGDDAIQAEVRGKRSENRWSETEEGKRSPCWRDTNTNTRDARATQTKRLDRARRACDRSRPLSIRSRGRLRLRHYRVVPPR